MSVLVIRPESNSKLTLSSPIYSRWFWELPNTYTGHVFDRNAIIGTSQSPSRGLGVEFLATYQANEAAGSTEASHLAARTRPSHSIPTSAVDGGVGGGSRGNGDGVSDVIRSSPRLEPVPSSGAASGWEVGGGGCWPANDSGRLEPGGWRQEPGGWRLEPGSWRQEPAVW